MPVQIGQSSPDFSNPLALMSDCHRRIEMFLEALMKVGNSPELDPGSQRALEAALRYFREAAPNHTADEESSLFPRLRSYDTAEVTALMNEVERLEGDHRRAESLHREVDRIGTEWLRGAAIADSEQERFRSAVSALHEIYREHILLEDKVVFPLAARTLSAEERLAVGREMAERRGVHARTGSK